VENDNVKFKNRQNSNGFTLIELLVSIAIIGLLATISIPAISKARAKARDGRRIKELRRIQTALMLYAQDHNSDYPYSTSTESNGEIINASSALVAALVPGYLGAVPKDPKPESYVYYYKTANKGTFFKLAAYIEMSKTIAQEDGGTADDFYEVYSYSGDKVDLTRDTLCGAMPAGCP